MDKIIYDEDSLLPLSGIQHFAFCQRQWALIHIENQWAENVRTVEGKQLHQRVDDPYFSETRHAIKTVRSVPLLSRRLGLYGFADVIEFFKEPGDSNQDEMTIVEYKRGKPKKDDRDEVQVCAQAMCLEEMLGAKLKGSFFYYGETKHRHKVFFSEELRERVTQLSKQMHQLFLEGITPPAKKSRHCNSCSMLDICVPKLGKKKTAPGKYLKKIISDELNNITRE